MNNSIIIEQTLHGYDGGHHLISSSVDLSDNSKRKMVVLSDLSGAETQQGFEDYYTGYYLPGDDYIVLSKTWYAYEMKRPGCVWTHSLLLKRSDLSIINRDIERFLNLFIRPDVQKQTNSYKDSIYYRGGTSNVDIQIDMEKLEYIIWVIWGNSSARVIDAADSSTFTNEILYLWTSLNKNMELNFSFCTGALSIRQFEKEYISLQIVPESRKTKMISKSKKVVILHSFDDIKTFPTWVQAASKLQSIDGWKDLNKFISLFGNKYLDYTYLSKFIKLYIASNAANKKLDIIEGVSVTKIIFDVNDNQFISNYLIELYLNTLLNHWEPFAQSIQILRYLVSNACIQHSEEQLLQLVRYSFVESIEESRNLVLFLAKNEGSSISESILRDFSVVITMESFPLFTKMDLELCSLFVTLNPIFAKCSTIWNQPKAFQEEILFCLHNSQIVSPVSISVAVAVLDNSKYEMVNSVYSLFGDRCIELIFDYLLDKKRLAYQSKDALRVMCRQYSGVALKTLYNSEPELSDMQVVELFRVINPYALNRKDLDSRMWTLLFDKISLNKLNNEEKEMIALFYLIVILKSDVSYPSYIVSFAFKAIHKSLANKSFSLTKWNKLEKLLPEIAWYKQWDKCERLRKGFREKGYKLIIKSEKKETMPFI